MFLICSFLGGLVMTGERRIAAVWLPRLATDDHARRMPGTGSGPLAAVTTERGRRMIVAVDAGAEALGVHPGMTLADARAVEPALQAFDADPLALAGLLVRLAGWCNRYTPWAAPDGADGLVLDVTGCAHLFDGEAAMLADLAARLAGAGYNSRAAATSTPAAAWALSRFGDSALNSPHAEELSALSPKLAPLPIAALRLPAETVEGLAAVGLRRIGDLYPLPRASLAARFGPTVGRRLDQALGREPEPLSPLHPVPPHSVRIAFAEPIATPDQRAAAVRHLLAALCRSLERTGEGARRIVLAAFRVDRRCEDAPQTLTIGTHRPVRDPAALLRLFAEKLDRIDPGPGIEVMTLAAEVAEPLIPAQTDFDRPGQTGAALEELVDRLANRLGEESVLRLVPRQSWLPERGVAPAPPLTAPSEADPWPADRVRPVRLLAPPDPVEAMAPVPDDPPLMFRWKGALHRVRFADGPERIEAEWWRRDGEPRDYYRVEDTDGRRFWLYRQGLYRPGARPQWFLHGVFG
jgi:protein ImuB